MKEEKNVDEVKTSFIDAVREVIETGKSAKLDRAIDSMNDQLGSKVYIESFGEGADILFRLVNKISAIEGDILTNFNNIVVLGEILMNAQTSSDNEVFISSIVNLVKLSNEEPTPEKVIVEVIRNIASSIEGDGEFRLKCNHKYFDCLTELGVV
jgi:hypothetical protein